MLKAEIRWLVLIVLVTAALFANSLGGEFVYDDKRQLAGNTLIQTPSLYGKALSNDVWAFKGDGTMSASNYWRPTFTAWCILNFRLFGLEPWGWHLLNILLQAGVCIFAFLLLRKWGVSEYLALAITIVFAVHPSHSESIAWISGSPDLLFGVFFLASLWFAEGATDKDQKKRRTLNLALAVIFYALALGAKEIAVLCFPIYYLIFTRRSEDEGPLPRTTVITHAGVFGATAAAYFITRWIILGQISKTAEGTGGLANIILTAPSIFIFYIGQVLLPYRVGINYPLRPVEAAGLTDFFVPLVISIVIFGGLVYLARRSFVQKIGLAIFILPLLGVFNVNAFPPDQIVHDRYLYLPLLGFLMVVIPAIAELLKRFFANKAEQYFAVILAVLSIPLAVQTVLSNQSWTTEQALWKHAVTVDPGSAASWASLGAEYADREQVSDAIDAFNKSIAIRPIAQAYNGRAQNLIKAGKTDDAIKDLQTVIAMEPSKVDLYAVYQSYEALAFAYVEKKAFDQAEALLIEGRNRMPMYRAALTEKLAVVLYLQNRKPEALKELEGMKAQARAELLPASKSVFLRLGMLYVEAGRKDEARSSLQEYLALTATAQDKKTPVERKQAENLLKSLR